MNRGTDNVTNRAHTHEGNPTDNNQDTCSQMNFAKDCLECHNPHGTTNLEMVNTTINGLGVTFTARLGAELARSAGIGLHGEREFGVRGVPPEPRRRIRR